MAGFATARKRARALGASGGGTGHHWANIVTSLALLGLVPVWILVFGAILGRPYAEARAALENPFVAILFALTLGVGLVHFRHGVQVVLEDYAHGLGRQAMIVAAVCLTYLLLAAGLFAVARIAI